MDFMCGNSSGWIREGAVTKAFFPISEEEGNTENTDIPRANYCANRTWEYKIIQGCIQKFQDSTCKKKFAYLGC